MLTTIFDSSEGKQRGTKFDEAREQMLQVITMLDELQIRPRYAVGLMYLGEPYSDTGQREKPIENLKKTERCSRK